MLNNVWFVDGDLEWNLLPIGLGEGLLDLVWLLLVLSNGDLSGSDVRSLLDDLVVDSDGALVGHRDFLLDGHLVVDGVWNLLGHNVWDLVNDLVWHLSGGDIWDSLFNLEWHLSFNGVRDLSGNFDCFESLDLVLFSDVLSLGNLVWNLLNGHNWDLLSNLVLFGNVLSHSVDVSVIRGVSSAVWSGSLSPLSSKASETDAEATSSSKTDSIETEAIAEKKGITTKETITT